MGLTILFVAFFACLIIGMPVAFALALSVLCAFWYEGLPMFLAFQRMVAGLSVYSLLAIPFFIFAGEIMLHGGIAHRLVRLSSAVVGWMRGGLGIVGVFASMLFGGISGSAVADASALGSILIPMMKREGYAGDYAVNVTVSASVAGVVIPPSHNMILFAVAAGGGVSVSRLFFAGIMPGILMCLCLAVAAYVIAVRRGYPAERFPGLGVLAFTVAAALPGLLTAVIIIGGVLSGVMTVTESGAFGAIYALCVALLVYRDLTWKAFKSALVTAVSTTSMVMVLVASANAFAYLLALYQVPDRLAHALSAVSSNAYVILLMLNMILLMLGMIMDMAPLILICTPIFLPMVKELGMNPIQFGVIMMMNLGLGLCTPPVGSCLFVGCAVGDIRIDQAVRSMGPFYVAMVAALMLVTYVPAFSLYLPGFL